MADQRLAAAKLFSASEERENYKPLSWPPSSVVHPPRLPPLAPILGKAKAKVAALLFASAMATFLATLQVAALGSAPSHILSDTPSYLRTRGALQKLFTDDLDAARSASRVALVSSGACDCSGRGTCGANSTVCTCNSGHSGARCQYAGTAFVMAAIPANMPKARAYHTLTAVGDRLYMFGGMTYTNGKANRLNDLHYLDTKTHRWTTPYATGHWPSHRTGHSTTLMVGGKGGKGPRLIVFGGINSQDAYCADLDVFAIDSQQWSRLAIENAPPSRARHTAVALGGERAGAMMVFGGASYKAHLQLFNDVYILMTEADPPRWHTPAIVGPRPRKRSGHSATLLEDAHTVLVFGGDGGTDAGAPDPAVGYLNDVWLFSLADGWRHKNATGALPEPRTLHAATRVGNHLVVTGGDIAGVAGARGEMLEVCLLDLHTFVWRRLQPRGELPYGRFGHQLAYVGSSLLLVGGMRFGGLAGDSSVMGNLLEGMPELLMPECPVTPDKPGATHAWQSAQLVDTANAAAYACSSRGACALGQCVCDEGYSGLRCELRCEAGWGGYMCTEPSCPCGEHGTCAVPGVCECAIGWEGAACEAAVCEQGCGHGVCAAPDTCECSPGWGGAGCTEPLCAEGCGAHGSCVGPGTCACAAQWRGVGCWTPVCAAGCERHGRCVAPHECSCDAGWNGEACDYPVCPTSGAMNRAVGPHMGTVPSIYAGIEQTEGAICSGHGKCGATGCGCDAGWKGHACEEPICPSDCSMHGVCVAPGLCKCVPGWGGAGCATPDCFSAATPCSAHGNCTGPATCACEAGWHGHDCSLPLCDNACSRHGECVAPGKCQCVAGWAGGDCSVKGSSGVHKRMLATMLGKCLSTTAALNCSGHGSCEPPGICHCDPGWAGPGCAEPQCVRQRGCNGRGGEGVCVAPRTCACNVGYGGDDCGEFSCPGDCSAHGDCVAPNTCRCFGGYGGPDCSLAACTGGCGGHGECTSPEECTCHSGWKGGDCMTPDCGEAECGEADGHGVCVGPGTCNCTLGWTGADCSRAACPNDCSAHGTCLRPLKCACFDGWGGDDCATPLCEGNCSGAEHGTCYSPGVCSCRGGWTGLDCTEPVCPLNCSGHGACVGAGACACFSGWQGVNCSLSATPDLDGKGRRCGVGAYGLLCHGHGHCPATDGACECFAGWGGDHCDEPVCPAGCSGHGVCAAPGECKCELGWSGKQCDAPTCVVVCDGGSCAKASCLYGTCTAVAASSAFTVGSASASASAATRLLAIPSPAAVSASPEPHPKVSTPPPPPCKEPYVPKDALERAAHGKGWTGCSDPDAALLLPTPTPTAGATPMPTPFAVGPPLIQQCTCFPGWKGARCSEPICPEGCNMQTRQGVCVSPGVCQCMAGWSGAACERPGCKDMCNGHGACLPGAPGSPVCSCGLGWGGASCAEPVCPAGCSGHGVCAAPGECKCYAGWGGADCSELACGEVAPKHGECVTLSDSSLAPLDDLDATSALNTTALCYPGWTGPTCATPDCPLNCSGHGKCVAPGKCRCQAGFSGLACDVCKAGVCLSTPNTDTWVRAAGSNLSGVAVDVARGLGYVSTWTSPASLLTVRLSDMSPVNSVSLAKQLGEERVRVLLLDGSRGLLYAATYAKPARVVKMAVGASDDEMRRVTAVELPHESGIVSGVLDEDGAYGFFGTYTSPGVIARVELETGREPRPRGRLVLNEGENNLYVALRDGPYAYFGTCVGDGTVLVKIHLPTFKRVSTIRLAGVSYLSAGAIEPAGPTDVVATAVLATFTRPAMVVRVGLSSEGGSEAEDVRDVSATQLSLGEGNDDAYSVVALPGMAAVVLSSSPGRVAFASLPHLDEIRIFPLPGGKVGRGLAAISEKELLLGSYGGSPGALARISADGNCAAGGCMCSSSKGGGGGGGGGDGDDDDKEEGCSRVSSDISLAAARAELRLGASAGVVSALATNPLSGLVYAATWGRDGAPAQLQAVDAANLTARGPPTVLRAGFSEEGTPILAPERSVNSLLVLPNEQLLFAAMGLGEPGTLVQFRMGSDGALTRRSALGKPDLKHGIALALLDKMAKPSPLIYLVEHAEPPALLAVEALTLRVAARWPLLHDDREVGCGVVLPSGDVLLGMLGQATSEALSAPGGWAEYLADDHLAPGTNASSLAAKAKAGEGATKIVRLRTSHAAARNAADGLARAAELSLPTSHLVCALASPAGDFAYFASATTPAALYKVSVGSKLLALEDQITFDVADGPVSACAMDARRRIAYLGMGGPGGRVVGVSLDGFARLRGFLRAPGWLVAGVGTVASGSPLFAASTGASPANPPGLHAAFLPQQTASVTQPGRQVLVRVDDAKACGSCSSHGVCVGGACSCFAGYAGTNCERGPLCHNDCSGHGECLEAGSCSCEAGWKGGDCSKPACPHDCSGHGLCASPGKCKCSDGWSGGGCATPLCEGDCSGHGGCVAPATCNCTAGWGGYDCSETRCPEGCNRHGECTTGANGAAACECFVGWGGELCDEPVCPSDCAGRGQCVSPGVCRCSASWAGAACDQPLFAGGCAHGEVVVAAGVAVNCSCFDGWTGRNCDKKACPATCRGECTESGCLCPNPYLRGDDCNQPYCGATACSGRGHCALPAPGAPSFAHPKCICDAGYTGEDCELAVCPSGCGHGKCVAPGRCECLAGFSGVRCQWRDCDCGSRGRCVGTSENRTCKCAPGWGGPRCGEPLCPKRTPVMAPGHGMPGLASMVPMLNGGKDLRLRLDPTTGLYGVGFSPQMIHGEGAGLYQKDELVPQMMSYSALLELSSSHAASLAQSAATCAGHGSCIAPGSCLCDAGWGGADCSSGCMASCVHGTCEGNACVCLPGWSGARCETPLCANNCSFPHGDCSAPGGKCTCAPFYYGPDCAIGDGASERHCFSKGRCDERGVCLAGWTGVDCGRPACLHNCSRHGKCVSPGKCECECGYEGVDCSKPTCGKLGCSGNGLCVAPGACACMSGWTGKDCNIPLCAGSCSGAGRCVAPGLCQCDAGRDGDDCSLTSDGKLAAQPVCPSHCRNHGKCVKGMCICDPGFGGLSCEAQCDHSCSGHGVCSGPNVCACSGGWVGKRCAEAHCSSRCSGHGRCAAPGDCRCYAGWTGFDCSRPACPKDCGGHGECTSSPRHGQGICSCDGGWRGPSCEVPVCGGKYGNCNGNGNCTGPGECACNAGYKGHACEEPICPADCSGHGACSAPGVCSCLPGWSGAACDVAVCLSNCSYHGVCLKTDKDGGLCGCVPGYTGFDCSVAVCPMGCVRGRCTAPNTCECFDGWFGADCSEAVCPRNCSGRGVCESPGTCICNARAPAQRDAALAASVQCNEIEQAQGSAACARAALLLLDASAPSTMPQETIWGGAACELRRCPSATAEDCSNQGKCLNGTCACDKGWGGLDCSVPHCPSDCNAPQGMCLPGGTCECSPGWSGPTCGVPLCTANCSGFGTCVAPFTCECDDKHSGESCNVSDCAGVASCSGHGECVAPDTCRCSHGWGGPACDDEVCPGDCNCADPSNKSACHGTCMLAGLCLCELGWSGKDCGTRICPRNCNGRGDCVGGVCQCRKGWLAPDCAQGICPLNCSGHGTCDGDTAKCSCPPGYSGRACEIVECSDCSGHGRCEVANVCTCEPGWGGPSCATATCPNDCGGTSRGKCLGPNKCLCAPGWSGGNCSVPVCDGCSGHGRCVAPMLCQCEEGWKGPSCDAACCLNDCNHRGSCVAPNTCKCKPPWGGADCSGRRCERVSFLSHDAPNHTWQGSESHSKCLASGAGSPVGCTCDMGWGGEDCCEPVCPDGCSEPNGACVAPYRCKCRPGWTGGLCQINIFCRDQLNECSGHGKCADGGCACEAGWQGTMCQLRVCPVDELGPCGGAARGTCVDGVCQCTANYTGGGCDLPACPNGCSDKGYCGTDGRCHCIPGYTGDDCSQRGCPANCSGHGTCGGGYACVCDAGFTSFDCSLKACPSDCSGNGYCYNGTCHCYPNWQGDACDQPQLCPPHHGHGRCVCDPTKSRGVQHHADDGATTVHVVCGNKCDAGWAGPECNQPACPGVGNCSGHGRCVLSHIEGGACVCDPGYTGFDCSLKACPSDCGADASAHAQPHGHCYDGQCYCRAGWAGADCMTKACPHDCGEYGHCISGMCSCEPGWSGAACEHPVCLGGAIGAIGGNGVFAPHAHSHSAVPCKPHGDCNAYLNGARCECEPGWTGADCMLRTCELDCSHNGMCVNGSCFCAPGWHGRACEAPACSGSAGTTVGCNGRGECVEGVCACFDGYGGQDCADLTCPKECSGKGVCTRGVCSCMAGWTGLACDVPGCPSHCSGNGYCEGGVACKCYPGWDGDDCATSICSQGCSGHGACSMNNTCVCDEGFSGFDCSLSECPDGCGGIGICLGGACMCPGNSFGVACERNVCSGTPPCNGNGECVIKSPINADTGLVIGTPEPVCECFEGYHGLDCSLAECLHGCSGRGVCQGGLGPNAVATCLCDHGWGGADCSLSVCASNCSGRGACVNGSCWCEPGWSGPECSWQRCLFDCSGRGVCNGRGKCHCAPGWHGIDCSLFDWGEGDSNRVTQSCAAHCLDGCQEQCSAVAEVMGADSADDCLLHCTDLCVPACGEAQSKAQRQAAAAALVPPPPPAALPPPSPVATLSSRRELAYGGADLARELLDERVPEAMQGRLGMVEEREPSESTTGSYLDGLASALV